MKKYHKIQTLFLKDPETKYKTLREGKFAKPEFEYLKDNLWVATEKVDGINVRVGWYTDTDGEIPQWVEFGGRTDNAQIPTFLLKKLQKLFPEKKFMALYPEIPMTLYGEGYGAKIRKGGGNYIPDGCNFILFDVMINGNWLERENVQDIAAKLGIKTVPEIFTGTLDEVVRYCRVGFHSRLRDTLPEGLVIRPLVELQNRRGQRIITKLKLKDFANMKIN